MDYEPYLIFLFVLKTYQSSALIKSYRTFFLFLLETFPLLFLVDIPRTVHHQFFNFSELFQKLWNCVHSGSLLRVVPVGPKYTLIISCLQLFFYKNNKGKSTKLKLSAKLIIFYSRTV